MCVNLNNAINVINKITLVNDVLLIYLFLRTAALRNLIIVSSRLKKALLDLTFIIILYVLIEPAICRAQGVWSGHFNHWTIRCSHIKKTNALLLVL